MIENFSKNIVGYFTQEDFNFYTMVFESLSNNSKIVEIGCFEGRSSSHMATLIANSNKNINFYCIDTWKGSKEHQLGEKSEAAEVVKGTLFEAFTKNMESVKNFYIPIRNFSVEAAKNFEDQSLDFVFIDASHEYEDVKNDISAWLPKIKKGGILSGHDITFKSVKEAVEEKFIKYQTKGLCWYVKIGE